MAQILDEQRGTGEIIRDARYHHAALLADPATQHLAAAVKQRVERLQKAEQATVAADGLRLEQQALRARAEFLHDDLHRGCELEVLVVVRKDRSLPAYTAVYRDGLSALISLVGEEQEREVVKMCDALQAEHPQIAKKYKTDLLKLAQQASAAQKALLQAETDATHAFVAEVSARKDVSEQLRRNEGALLSLFPLDRNRVRLYYRDRRKLKSKTNRPD